MREVESARWAIADLGVVHEFKPTADGSFLRASGVGSCIRKQIYDGLELPPSTVDYQNSVNGLVAREIGNTLHEQIQLSLQKSSAFRDFVAEIPVSMPEYMRSGHTDGVYGNEDHDHDSSSVSDLMVGNGDRCKYSKYRRIYFRVSTNKAN